MNRKYAIGLLIFIAALAGLTVFLSPESSPPDSTVPSILLPNVGLPAESDSSTTPSSVPNIIQSNPSVLPEGYELDLDQIWVRGPDEEIGRVEEVAAQSTRQLLELAGRRNARPLVRDAESGQTRLLTEKITVRLKPSADPEAVAVDVGALRVEQPDYAPDYTIFHAENSSDALQVLTRLRAHPDTLKAEIQLARLHHKRALPNDTLIDDQWHLFNTSSNRTHINVASVWGYTGGSAIRGNGIRIGIVDDGLETGHPDFTGNVDTVNDWDWNGNDDNPNPGPPDDHGTACAGIAAARGNNNLGVSGVAPEATLVGLRLIADYVDDSQEAEAMVWRQNLIQIKSNSWGPEDSGELLEAPGPLTRAALATATTDGRNGLGTVFVWAGGNGGDVNDNSNYDGYANSIYTIAVGALDSSGNRSYYSERGANLHVVAPSDGGFLGITTTDLTGTNGYANGDYTDDFGGTSAATPVVAGVVALMLERNPLLNWRDIQEILIASAYKVNPTDIGWIQNTGGYSFHRDFGAGLVDAQAAVNLAATWSSLGTLQIETATFPNLNQSIPENNATGISRTFTFSDTHLRVEQVTITVDISHTARGNLEITLTSPSGMTSRLAEVRPDTGDHYDEWTFSSVRHWGESSDGMWTLSIADRSGSGNTNGGTLHSATLSLFGASAEPANPAPAVQIVSPAPETTFSPGTEITVEVEASDLDIDGNPGTVVAVDLHLNGNPSFSLAVPPYHFTFTPPNGTTLLSARATDNEGAIGQSAQIRIFVTNQPPTITLARLQAREQAYADTPLTLLELSADDPDNDPISFSYLWQSSTDGVRYVDQPDYTQSTLPAQPSYAGQNWRLLITPSDPIQSGTPFATDPVNLLARPSLLLQPGDAFTYTSGLVLRGSQTTLSKRAIIHEFSQGPSGGSSEWIEILTLQDTSLAFWDLEDAAGDFIVFLDGPVWDDIPAGTLIVIYNGNSRDPLLPPDNGDPSDGRMIVSSTDDTYFDPDYDDWIQLGNSGDSIFLNDDNSETEHEIAYGNSQIANPNIGTVGSTRAARFIGDSEAQATQASGWSSVSSLVFQSTPESPPGVSPGLPNSPTNADFIHLLRTGGLNQPALFRLALGTVVPEGLALDPETGTITGTVSPSATPANHLITLERSNSFGEIVQQRFTLRIGDAPAPTHAEWIANYPAVGFLTLPDDDPDGDGFANRLENVLGTPPDQPTTGLYVHQDFQIRHSFNPLHDPSLIPVYQWSTDLETWQPAGATHNGVPLLIVPRIVEDPLPPEPGQVELDISPATPTPFFLRIFIP